ncbi:craniofacial development protein 2-like [Diorhabda sublineata]|uniref:craniofacial development protein 2-like n=1 Tax=Diorhabda sublineata TaxID=1163346 RepID=UPI0024E0AB5B|nr:craniofacial development protein 2-like [Diorhabda sublineata]
MTTWQEKGLSAKGKRLYLELDAGIHKLDICALSETKKKDKGNSKYGNYILIYSGKNKNKRATSGVGLLLHESYENQISNIIYVNGRILQATINLQKLRPKHIISIYAPDSSKTQTDIDIFYKTLQTVLDGIPNYDEIINLGDFNARIGDELIPDIKNRFNEETINETINNTFCPHKPQHKYTFENTRGHKSTIDYVITNKNIHPTRIQDTRSLTSANPGTNHQLVIAKMRTTIQRSCKKSIEEVSKLNIESLSEESTKYLYQQRLREKIAANNIQETDDIETAWKKLKTNILQAAEEACGRRTIKKGGRTNTKPWFKQEVKPKRKENRTCYTDPIQQRIMTIKL